MGVNALLLLPWSIGYLVPNGNVNRPDLSSYFPKLSPRDRQRWLAIGGMTTLT